MKNSKILIIGLGKIGLNHLKAAEKFKKKIEIHVFDKKIIDKNLINQKVNLIKNLDNSHLYDLAIISTNSSERFSLLLKLIKNNNVKNILLEKFVFFKIKQFLKIFKILKNKKINVWVNCLRREISIFHKIKKKIKGDFKLTYKYNNWGLGCNSIHFLDLFCFLSNSTKIVINRSDLYKKIYKSRRKGYMEFKGLIEFKIKNSKLLIQDDDINTNKVFRISTNNKKFSFNKKENILTEVNIKNKNIKKYICEEPKVSLISYNLIKKILKKKKVNLSTLKESFLHHKILIDIFSSHLRKINHKKQLKIT